MMMNAIILTAIGMMAIVGRFTGGLDPSNPYTYIHLLYKPRFGKEG